jgi:ubiquinone/menaquinone biosynthesis C-methylase UbiE
LLHYDLTERIIAVYHHVYSELCYGFLERLYQAAMRIALTEAAQVFTGDAVGTRQRVACPFTHVQRRVWRTRPTVWQSLHMQTRTAIVIGTAALVLGVAASAQQQHPPAGHSDHMERRFDDPERYAKEFDDPSRDAWQMPDRIIETLGPKPGQSLADIGAGTGYFSIRLAHVPAAPTVYAVDIEPSMVEYVKARAARAGLKKVIAVQASADSPNLPAAVDTVLIVDTYHHIGNRVEYFRKLRASIKPAGRLAIVDFRKDAPTGPPPEFRFTEAQISAELAQAGYELAESHTFLPRQLFLVYRLK